MIYDYLVVGAGLFGAVFTHEATACGKRCLVLDKRSHIGGNVYTESVENVQVHRYGAHIFHTNDEDVWAYMNRFARFNRFTNAPIARYGDKVFNLPFNMNTFYQLWGVSDPAEAERIIDTQRLKNVTPRNLEEQALALVGADLYETLIKGYTEKQWGRKCTELPAFIIKRLPVRFTWDNAYFNDRFQGIPEGGYTSLVEKLLDGADIRLQTDYLADREQWNGVARKIVYTGMLDAYYDFRFGALEYRTLRFDTHILDKPNFQGNAVCNYTDAAEIVPWTRIIEHKHFEFGGQSKTVITYEYPGAFQSGESGKSRESSESGRVGESGESSESGKVGESSESGGEPYYPVNDEVNNARYARYRQWADRERDVIFGGRLADYQYYDMWQVVRNALDTAAIQTGQTGQTGQTRQTGRTGTSEAEKNV